MNVCTDESETKIKVASAVLEATLRASWLIDGQ